MSLHSLHISVCPKNKDHNNSCVICPITVTQMYMYLADVLIFRGGSTHSSVGRASDS